MTFLLETTPKFEDDYNKAIKKNLEMKKAIDNKIKQILEDPERFKPMHKPLQNFRRVHIMKSFVLLYYIKQNENTIILAKFSHQDTAYR